MLIKCFFRFILFAVMCFCIFGISNAKTTSKPSKSENDNGVKRKISRAHKSNAFKTLNQRNTDKSVKNAMPEITVVEDASNKSSFLLPSPLKEEKAFKPIKRRKAIRNKINEVYSKETIADKKIKDLDHSISYLPERARASITRSMHQIVVEKEKGLKPKIEYKSVKYTMTPEEGGNDIQTSLNKKDPFIKEKDFSNSVSKFLIKRKYIIGSLAGMAADNKAVQYILDGQTVFNDKYLTSTADPIAFKQKSDQKSMNKLEEVKLIKSKTKKKKSEKRLNTSEKKSKSRKTVKTKSKKINRDRYDAEMNTISERKIFQESPITKYDKMPMLNKLKYLQRVNKENSKTQIEVTKKSKTNTDKRKKKEMTDVFFTRRKSIRPHQNELKSKEKPPTQIVPISIEIDTKDWKTNYRRKKDKLLKSLQDSTIKSEKDLKKKRKNKSKIIKEVIQQKSIHSFRIKPNTTIEVGNTEFTVGIPPNLVPLRPRRKEKVKTKTKAKAQHVSKTTPPKKKSLKPPATLKAFRSDELREVDTVTVSNIAKKIKSNKEKIPKPSTVPLKPKAPSKKTKLPPAITKHFPLKIEFVTEKVPVKAKIKKSEKLKTAASPKKFITNGLADDPKKSRIITSSENLNVNLDHYASEFTRTGITNGENNIVVGTLSGISDRANAGMLNLQVDTVQREEVSNAGSQKSKHLLPKVPKIASNMKANVEKVKKLGNRQTDFSISLLAAHEVESTTRVPKIQKMKPTKKTPVRKSPRLVLRNNQSSGKNFVFSFKTNKKPKVKIPKVPSVSFQPAFIYKDTAEIHRSENSLYTNSIHDKADKKQFFKHDIIRDKHTDFRWPMPSPTVPIQGIPVTQPPTEVSTLGMIISGDFVSSFAEQAFNDISYSSNTKVNKIPKGAVNLKLGSSKLVKNDFIFPDQSLFTPAPKAISTMDRASAAKRRNGLYSSNSIYSSDIQKEIEALLNSTETVQLTDIPGNIDIPTSTVPLPQMQDTFIPKMPSNLPFVYRAETQAGETKMQKLNTKAKIGNVGPTTSVNNMVMGITGYDIGLSLKKDKLKKSNVKIIQTRKAFEKTTPNPLQDIFAETKPSVAVRAVQRPVAPVETVILPTVSTTKQVVTEKTTTSTEPITKRPTTKAPTTTTTTTRRPPTTTTQTVVSKFNDLNLISEKAKDTLQKINEVFKGAPEGIVAISKTDAFKKYRKAAKEVMELDKTPTMVPAVGIIKPLRKSEAIYKFSRYGNQRGQGIVEDNAIKREIKKLLIQQNTIYPAPVQNGMVSYQRVTPMMNQNVYAKNDITSHLYNTPEMTSMMMATESILPQQNNAYVQNYNFPGANRQVFASSARYPSYQPNVRVTPPTPLNPQINVYQPPAPIDSSLRLFWTTVLPTGGTMDEFAIVKDDERVIYVVSDQVPLHGSLDKSSTLLDFTVGHMAMRFDIDGTNGQICFVTHTSAKFQKTKEALQRRVMAQVVTLADPIQLYAELTTHVPHHNLHTVGGAQFYKFCKAAIKQDNVYELVMEPTGNIGATTFTGSGLVYPSEPGLSVPITINVESLINLKNKRF